MEDGPSLERLDGADFGAFERCASLMCGPGEALNDLERIEHMRGAGKPQTCGARSLLAQIIPRLSAAWRSAGNDLQDLARRALRRNSQALHGELLLGRPLAGARSEPDLKMPIRPQQFRSADFGKPARHLPHGRLNEWRQVTRAVRAMAGCRREAQRPGHELRRTAQRNVE